MSVLSQLKSVTPKAVEATGPVRYRGFISNVITEFTEDTNDYQNPEVRIWSGNKYIGVMPSAMIHIAPQLEALNLELPVKLIKVDKQWIATQAV